MYTMIKRIEGIVRHHVIYPCELAMVLSISAAGIVLILGILGSAAR